MQEDLYYDAHRPPLLQHQEATDAFRGSSPPVFRSYNTDHEIYDPSYADEAYEEAPLYRSISTYLRDSFEDRLTFVEGYGQGYGMCAVECCAESFPPQLEFQFELPHELFEYVLSALPSYPDLFNAMSVNRHWHEAASATYARRTIKVAAGEDTVIEAIASATPGDTILLQEGVHWLSTELILDKPLRLGSTATGNAAIIASRHPSLLRTRATVQLNGLTFCRMGDAEGYPNAVIVAESGALSIEHCRITCGGTSATTIEEALEAFGGAPLPGESWESPPPPACIPLADEVAGLTRQGPQSGVWVGACAVVTLRYNTIACCSGPGVKIYRGRLAAESNTIAFSRSGANVVSNSGRVRLTDNAIHGARGDGVSSWNNSHIALERNTIHSNLGTGITINTGGGSVAILENSFFGNTHTAVQFATSNVKHVTIGSGDKANDWSGNEAGGLQGLHPRAMADNFTDVGLPQVPTSTPTSSAATDSSKYPARAVSRAVGCPGAVHQVVDGAVEDAPMESDSSSASQRTLGRMSLVSHGSGRSAMSMEM
ncbi:hypothetical protein AB1Y20_019398 [Prymnesium parvum]|uniref:F-box domain-containing protein n=1 Tax=Prymnesium parvum TaxID=97485 RepID=A0AB34JR40_PRYPA|mmetsp:Transcript_12014/g.29756  ORF Transcript_12014/g.29756 Transcript_12014/m.29756 type:complete len:542 (+) Transcript_12014:135-1760(+)